MSEGKKMTSSRRHHLKSVILQIAATWLEQETVENAAAKEAYMAERCTAPDMSGDQAALMEICKKLHLVLDKLDEERYDCESKVQKADKEIDDLKMKVVELGGVKKPALKKVRMSADSMLQALLGGKHKVTMDLRSNLKQVKKEVKEEVSLGRVVVVLENGRCRVTERNVSVLQGGEAAGDWRKNIEDKADRKKMFETS
ncbi:Troponin I, fast skeletal muscle [Liparis tanakae]|uniref:Troponin I, fast skeletal muscle n=1 Tax=Liparis tanakae TaxID=230148 RepID=A0A4Z2G6S2_9TELE|nr:Troponin I, fast skeletal muscle [Liparis tanakae]